MDALGKRKECNIWSAVCNLRSTVLYLVLQSRVSESNQTHSAVSRCDACKETQLEIFALPVSEADTHTA